jgi:hypothetical protein
VPNDVLSKVFGAGTKVGGLPMEYY